MKNSYNTLVITGLHPSGLIYEHNALSGVSGPQRAEMHGRPRVRPERTDLLQLCCAHRRGGR